jgi:peptide deformylase
VDCEGEPVTAEVGGFHAGVVQHENDHLDGILYPMRMTDFRQMGFDDEVSWAEELTLRMDMIRTEWAASSGRV